MVCSKQHKVESGCTGVRSRTQFIPLEKFDDNAILDDYNFLIEMERTNDQARRLAYNSASPRTYFLAQLQTFVAQKRNIHLAFMPPIMTRRKENTTFFDKNKQKVYWKVEWIFCDGDKKVKIVDARLDESTTIHSAISTHFQDPLNHQTLKLFVKEGVDNLHFLLKAEFNNKNEYYILDSSLPVSGALAYKPIIEHPTIYIVLTNNIDNYKILRDDKPAQGESPSKRSRVAKEEESVPFFPLV